MANTQRYDEDFKKSLVALYNNGKSQTALSKEYGVFLSALGKLIRLCAEIKTEDGANLPLNRLKNCKNETHSLKRKILS